MKICVFGQTDKRAVIYTLLKLCQTMGDVCFISYNTYYNRLINDVSTEEFFQNIAVFITDASAEDAFAEINHVPEDYDYIIFDNKWDESADVFFYVEGAGPEAYDSDLIENLGEKLIKIKIGTGKGAIPYSVKMFTAIENTEYYKKFLPINDKLSSDISKALTSHLGMPTKNIQKVVMR